MAVLYEAIEGNEKWYCMSGSVYQPAKVLQFQYRRSRHRCFVVYVLTGAECITTYHGSLPSCHGCSSLRLGLLFRGTRIHNGEFVILLSDYESLPLSVFVRLIPNERTVPSKGCDPFLKPKRLPLSWSTAVYPCFGSPLFLPLSEFLFGMWSHGRKSRNCGRDFVCTHYRVMFSIPPLSQLHKM